VSFLSALCIIETKDNHQSTSRRNFLGLNILSGVIRDMDIGDKGGCDKKRAALAEWGDVVKGFTRGLVSILDLLPLLSSCGSWPPLLNNGLNGTGGAALTQPNRFSVSEMDRTGGSTEQRIVMVSKSFRFGACCCFVGQDDVVVAGSLLWDVAAAVIS